MPGFAVIRGKPPVLVLVLVLVLEDPVDAASSDSLVLVVADARVAVVEGPAVMVTGIMPAETSSLPKVVYTAGWEY